MLATEQVETLAQSLAPLGDQVISLYLDVNPASPDNRRKAWALRARAAMDELPLPNGASKRIADRLRGQVAPDSRTLAVFAHPTDDEVFHTLAIAHSLRSVDGHDGAIARLGEPFLAPIQLTMLRRRPSLVLQLSGDRVRLFLVDPSGSHELQEIVQTWDETFWRTDESAGSFRPGETQRGGSPKDAYDDRTSDWVARMYKSVGNDLPALARQHGAARVILSGTSPDVAAFEAELEPQASALVGERIPLQPNPEASAGSLHPVFMEAVRAAEAGEADEALDSARENGVIGAARTLEAVNENRVHLLVVPDVPYQQVWRCQGSGRLFAERSPAAAECEDDGLESLPFADALPQLVADFGMDLRFVSGESDRRLREEMGGLAGLLRW